MIDPRVLWWGGAALSVAGLAITFAGYLLPGALMCLVGCAWLWRAG